MRIVLVLFLALAFPAFATPEFVLTAPWFEAGVTSGVTNGVTVVRTAEGLRVVPETPLAETAWARLETRVTFTDADVGSARELLATAPAAEFALAVAATDRATFAYYAATSEGWLELTGATPSLGTSVCVTLELDYATSPGRVKIWVDAARLTARNSEGAIFTLAEPAATTFTDLLAEGSLQLGPLVAERELLERVTAVVRGACVAGYYPSLAAARAAAETSDADVWLLRGTSVSTPADLAGVTRLNASALRGARPAMTYTGDPADLASRVSTLCLPPGYDDDLPLFAPTGATALAALHIHGDEGVPYALYPADAAFNIRRDDLQLDGGGFTAFLTTPEGGRTFLRGLTNGACGSENALYVNGLGALTLCGTNAFTGTVCVEATTVADYGVLATATTQPLTASAQLDYVLTSREGESPPRAEPTPDEPCIVLAELAEGVSVTVSARYEPGEGRLARLAREGNLLVAWVAEAPDLRSDEDGFALAPDAESGLLHLTATIDNAVIGFRYGYLAADAPTGPFEPVGDWKTASANGPLVLELDEPPTDRRFYRFCVEAP